MNTDINKKLLLNAESYIDSIPEQGSLAFSCLMKRISDLMISQVQELYTKSGHKFKPTWFPTLHSLYKSEGLDLKTLSKKRRVTPSAISQVVKELIANDLVFQKAESNDLRQKKIFLTEKGAELLKIIVPQLQTIEATIVELLGKDFEIIIQSLLKFEEELLEKPMFQRQIKQ